MSRPCYDEVAIGGERALQRLFVIVALAVLIALPAGAQDLAERLAYDPSACQSDGGLAEAIAAAESAACLAMIAAHPVPDFQRARLDSYSINHFSFWRVSPRALVYAAPGGVAVGQMDDGFNFVQAVDTYLPGLDSRRWRRLAAARGCRTGRAVAAARQCCCPTIGRIPSP